VFGSVAVFVWVTRLVLVVLRKHPEQNWACFQPFLLAFTRNQEEEREDPGEKTLPQHMGQLDCPVKICLPSSARSFACPSCHLQKEPLFLLCLRAQLLLALEWVYPIAKPRYTSEKKVLVSPALVKMTQVFGATGVG
jgi:hypothetical protein